MDKVILRTPGFIHDISEEKQAEIMTIALKHINPKTTWVVFKKDAEQHYEDEDRTLVIPMDIPEKVYAIQDDYHDPETLSQEVGEKVNTRYTLTFLLADEY